MTLQQIIDAAEAAKTGGAANLGATPELVWELLQALAQNGGGGGGGGNTLYTGDGTIADALRTVDINGGAIVFSNGNLGIGVTPSADQLFIAQSAGDRIYVDKTNHQVGFNSFDGALAYTNISTSAGVSTRYYVQTTIDEFDHAVIMSVDATNKIISLSSTYNNTSFTLNDDNQTFTFIGGNLGIGATPSADQLFVVNDGVTNLIEIDKANFVSNITSSDGTAASGLITKGNLLGTFVAFELYADDGSGGLVDISGDAIAQTITLTAANGIIFSNQARLKNYTVATLPSGTAGDIAYVTDALLPTFLATVAGSGAVVTPVFYDGTNWKSF